MDSSRNDRGIQISRTKTSYPRNKSRKAALVLYLGNQKWAYTASIDTDGSLINYTAGQPFSDKEIKNATNDVGGFMIGWNNIHRWQHFGYQIDIITMAYVSGSNNDGPLNEDEGLLGGGKLRSTPKSVLPSSLLK